MCFDGVDEMEANGFLDVESLVFLSQDTLSIAEGVKRLKGVTGKRLDEEELRGIW